MTCWVTCVLPGAAAKQSCAWDTWVNWGHCRPFNASVKIKELIKGYLLCAIYYIYSPTFTLNRFSPRPWLSGESKPSARTRRHKTGYLTPRDVVQVTGKPSEFVFLFFLTVCKNLHLILCFFNMKQNVSENHHHFLLKQFMTSPLTCNTVITFVKPFQPRLSINYLYY